MAYKIEFIKNPPSVQELTELYKSDFYKQLLDDFIKKTNAKVYNGGYDTKIISQYIQRRYLLLNIPMEEVLTELKENRDSFLAFCVEKNNFYKDYEDKHPDGEFPEGEEPDEEEKSETIKVLGISPTFLLDYFCEYYLVKLGDKERFLHYLKTSKMPYAKKYLSKICKVYKNSLY